jgi:ribosomal protein RSM22 (predicted rRNA methylase)
MIATLPERLSEALEAEVTSVPQSALRAATEALTAGYRGKSALRATLSPAERVAYLAVRFPSTFAVAGAVWRDLAHAIPAAGIRTVLDVGAGPGTASLASAGILETGTQYTYLERDTGWRPPAERLAGACGLKATFMPGALTPDLRAARADIVVASYALNELPPPTLAGVIAALWATAAKALVVIEPGTPKGFEIVRTVRETTLTAGGHAAAPCTHDAPCPMTTSDWCHRPERVARSAMHRGAKQASLGFEDEKFSYAILTREQPQRWSTGRIVRKPMRNAGHVHLDLCTAEGLKRTTVARSDGSTYRDARDAAWGDVWPPQTDD